MNDSERLTRLEERYAHLQRHQAEQDKVMLELAEELARLKAELASVRSREVSGPAADLYLALWNRLPFPRVTGDASVAELWRQRSAVD